MKTEDVLELPKQNFQIIKCKNTSHYKKFIKDKVVNIDGDLIVADFKLSERIIMRQLAGAYNKNKLKACEDLVDSTNDRLIIFYNYNIELENSKNYVLRKIKLLVL